MASKNISIRQDVYEKLLRRKRTGESFSGVIERLLEEKGTAQNLRPFFGLWKDLPSDFFEDIKQASENMRRELNDRFEVV